MNRKTLVTAVTIGALGSAGIALAEGTSTEKKQTQKQTQEQPELQQGQTSSETAASAPQQEQQNVQKKGVARLDSVRISSLDETQIKTLQQKLADLGYYMGNIDGIFGPKSRAALSQYFRDQATLVAQGKLSEVSMTSLGFEESEIERVRGVDQEGGQGVEERTPTRGSDDDTGMDPEMNP